MLKELKQFEILEYKGNRLDDLLGFFHPYLSALLMINNFSNTYIIFEQIIFYFSFLFLTEYCCFCLICSFLRAAV